MKKELRNNPSKFYEFKDKDKEICIKRYDTPMPWMNYLSNGTFHTMLSQAGGGVAFHKSPQIWRINRYRFYHLPTDRSGFYIYIKDNNTGDFWSPSSEPTVLKPDSWTAYHGMGYTRFEAERDGVKVVLTFFVGKTENALIWNVEIENTSNDIKDLDLFSFVEFGMMEFLREVSWVCYMKHQMQVTFSEQDQSIIFKYAVENQPKPNETPLVYMASDYKLKGYDGDRDEFIGCYRSETNPFAIENNGCSNSTLFGGDPCGALQSSLVLKPGESKTINIFLGTGMNESEISNSLLNLRQQQFIKKEFKELHEHWNNFLSKFSTEVPDDDVNRMVNIWNPYQAQRNFLFSRNISFYATGTFRGVGYRDTSQDILSQIPFDIEESKDKIRMLLKEQYEDGHANHYFYPNEGFPPVTSIHSDDHLWPLLTVWALVVEEGNLDFLNEEIYFYDNNSATVYEHLKRSVQFTMNNLGERGLPLMLKSDWNDQMFRVCREGKGESFWTSMQLGVVLPKIIELAKLIGKNDDVAYYSGIWRAQQELINTIGWDGKWFRRAIMDSGLYLGTEENPEAKIWLNAQSWAVMSGYVSKELSEKAMDVVKQELDTELGIKLLHPSITTFPDPKDPLTNYNKGTGENAAIFCHANTWAIIAECILGRGDIAYKYYKQLIPSLAMEKTGIWRYKAEPFVYSSNLFGPESDKFGLANVSWLTGTAAWMYIAITQHILGVQPVWEGLRIDPCLPSDWEKVCIQRKFRGNVYNISINKTKGVCKGVKSIIFNGVAIKDNVLMHANATSINQVIVEM